MSTNEGGQMPERNPWKLATLSLAGAVVAVLAAGSVIALLNRSEAVPQAASVPPAAAPPSEVGPAPVTPPLPANATQSSAASAAPSPAHAPKPPARQVASAETGAPPPPPSNPGYREPARPTAADIETCNHYASSQQSRTTEAVKDGAIGGLLGAALGAAGGAIAGGGGGAGKGAAIGGLVGVAGGSLYDINSANQNNARAQAAYRDCMEKRGYANASY